MFESKFLRASRMRFSISRLKRWCESRLAADDDSLAAGGDGNILLIGWWAAGFLIGVSAAGSTAVELDALAGTGDSVSLAWAGRNVGDIGAGGDGGVWSGAEGRASGGWWAELVVRVVLIVDGGLREAACDISNGGGLKGAVLGLEDSLGRVWGDGLGRLDLGDGEWASLGDVGVGSAGLTAGGGRRVLAGGGGRLAGGRLGWLGRRWLGWLAGGGWNIEDVQNATSGGLGGGGLGGVVGNMVPINDVVVPVSLTSLECGALESECSLPCASLGGGLVGSKRKLTRVVVPRTEEMYGLDSGGGAEIEAELNGGHCWFILVFMSKNELMWILWLRCSWPATVIIWWWWDWEEKSTALENKKHTKKRTKN
jgi:hypothetical protein